MSNIVLPIRQLPALNKRPAVISLLSFNFYFKDIPVSRFCLILPCAALTSWSLTIVSRHQDAMPEEKFAVLVDGGGR